MRGPEHEEAKKNMVVECPMFYYGGSRDMVCRPEMFKAVQDAGLLPKSKGVITDAGHYCMHKNPQHFGENVIGWLKETF
jgi:soluble epoxide hydrolase / lipid-phosphate phosphatase